MTKPKNKHPTRMILEGVLTEDQANKLSSTIDKTTQIKLDYLNWISLPGTKSRYGIKPSSLAKTYVDNTGANYGVQSNEASAIKGILTTLGLGNRGIINESCDYKYIIYNLSRKNLIDLIALGYLETVLLGNVKLNLNDISITTATYMDIRSVYMRKLTEYTVEFTIDYILYSKCRSISDIAILPLQNGDIIASNQIHISRVNQSDRNYRKLHRYASDYITTEKLVHRIESRDVIRPKVYLNNLKDKLDELDNLMKISADDVVNDYIGRLLSYHGVYYTPDNLRYPGISDSDNLAWRYLKNALEQYFHMHGIPRKRVVIPRNIAGTLASVDYVCKTYSIYPYWSPATRCMAYEI